MSNRFSNYLVDKLTKTQIQEMYNLVQATKNQKSEQYQEESGNPEQIISSISKSITNELEHIALPGYSYQKTKNLKSSIARGIILSKIKPQSIEKQEAIQNVLTNHYQLEENQITVLTERIKQNHLNYKYFAYYAVIKGTGILIVLNDEYAQAARIKRVETTNDAEVQLSLLIKTLENKDKKTMDQIQGFEAFDNTYTSIYDLQELYIRKINEHLATSSLKIDLTGTAEVIWKQVKGQKITINNREYRVNTIQDFIELAFTVIALGKIGSTPVRDIINRILGLEEDEKITSHRRKEKGKANELRVKNARGLLKKKAISGDLGEEAKLVYNRYLIENTEINLTGTTEEIWKRIQGKMIIYKNRKFIVNTIKDLIELSFTTIIKGKIGSTPVRDIINRILGLEEDEKITSHQGKEKGKANELRVKNARILLKDKALAGELGEKAKLDYNTYLIASPEIDLNGSTEEIWKRIQGKTIISTNREYRVNTIQDFLELSFTTIIKGKIGSTPVRDIINRILGLEEDEKITYHIDGPKAESNKLRVENARILLKDKALAGELGEKTKLDYNRYLITNTEINLTGTAEEIWKRVQGKMIIFQNREYKINSIHDFLKLPISVIILGKIESTPVRKIINAILGLEEDEKITSHQNKKNGKTNKLRVEKARILLKDKALAGELGEEAQRDIQRTIEAENIQTQIKEVIEEI